jgi:hypothetical protein
MMSEHFIFSLSEKTSLVHLWLFMKPAMACSISVNICLSPEVVAFSCDEFTTTLQESSCADISEKTPKNNSMNIFFIIC